MASSLGLQQLLVSISTLLVLLLASSCRGQEYETVEPVGFETSNSGSYTSDYRRIPEVQTQCPFTSSFSGANDDSQGPDPAWVIRHELSFVAGDWLQDSPAAAAKPLLKHLQANNGSSRRFDPLQLVSLWITDVNLRSKSGVVRLSALLTVAVTRERSISYYNNVGEGFEDWEGFTRVTALMEGVYFESAGQRGVCMVGCTVLGVGRSCDLYLQLSYPSKLSLLSREVHGFLKSTSKRTDPLYFDTVRIVSQLGSYSNYNFDNGSLFEPACSSPSPPPAGVTVYHEDRFCSLLMESLMGRWIELSAPGPFAANVSRMQVLDIRCLDIKDKANVSLVFRAVPRSHNPELSLSRTGARDGLALAAEGRYSSSTGELCMIGCWNSSKSSCNVRVSLFLPLSFTITQRQVVLGKLSSLVEDRFKAPPADFTVCISQGSSWEILGSATYTYTRTDEAVRTMERDELQSGLRGRLKSSVLEFPTLGESENAVLSLGQDLTVSSTTLLLTSTAEYDTVEIQLLAIEDHIALTNWYREEFNVTDEETLKKFLRVAVMIVFKAGGGDVNSTDMVIPYQWKDQISAEGVYVPRTGKMHLVGCMQRGGKPGQDCDVSITVQYPPKNTESLANPTLVMDVGGLRFETVPILYGNQRREILSRKLLESVLSAFTLSLMVVCIVLQLMHVKKTVDSVPYVSLVMLGVHAFGYSVPLITGAEALFARLTSHHREVDNYFSRSYVIKDGYISQIVLYLVKLLSLAAFLLMLRLCQKVIRSRIRLSTRFPLEPRRVPGEMKTIKLFTFIHLVGFLFVLGFHYTIRDTSVDLQVEQLRNATVVDWDGNVRRGPEQDWLKELKEYGGLVEDLFLLPQVIANSLWTIKGKPLRPAYYIGVTVLRLLPHAYSALSKPLFNPFFADQSSVYANPRMDFYTGVGDLMIPLLAAGLAAAVYVQQRWNGVRLEKILRQGSNKLMRYGSKMYERLPSSGTTERGPSAVKFEAEMMPSTVEDNRAI